MLPQLYFGSMIVFIVHPQIVMSVPMGGAPIAAPTPLGLTPAAAPTDSTFQQMGTPALVSSLTAQQQFKAFASLDN